MFTDFTRSILQRFKSFFSVLLQRGRVRVEPDYDDSDAAKPQQRQDGER